MEDHPYGWLSLLPPAAAIGLAILTRRVMLSLFLGLVVGVMITSDFNPATALVALCETHLWKSLSEPDHLRVFLFTAMMSAMVAVMQHSRGMQGIVQWLAPLAGSRRGGQLVTWLLGLIVFFDDYANTLLLGGTMRPLADRLGISREKLAYIVDSTAAPVAGLAIVSTWVAGEIGFIADGLAGLEFAGSTPDAFALFLGSIPYRFYVLGALVTVPLVAILRRDLPPMLQAERRAVKELKETSKQREDANEENSGHSIHAIAPVAVMLSLTLVLLLLTGKAKVENENLSATWFNYFSQGNSYVSLLYGSLAGLAAALLLPGLLREFSWKELSDAAFKGAGFVLPALGILWLAWALSDITKKEYVDTGGYLGGLIGEGALLWLPTVVFLLASAIAFATGTSWGTMGLLMPITIGVAHKLLANAGPVSAGDPLLLASIGSVLAGAIFGDHCSPISDTTVLSSQASGCDHIAHVRTQMPYALLVAAVSILCGTIPVAFGINVWLLLPVGLLAIGALLYLLGRPTS